MDKSADAFRTISEVAQDLDLPQHVLRFWESRFPQIKPLKRAGGRRYYRPADIVLLRAIRRLLYDEGYTIKGVQRLLKDRGPRNLEDPPTVAESDTFLVAPEPARAFVPRTEVSGGAEPDGNGRIPPPAQLPSRSPPSSAGPEALYDALTYIEECERILAAVRAPAS